MQQAGHSGCKGMSALHVAAELIVSSALLPSLMQAGSATRACPAGQCQGAAHHPDTQ
jgi:hypothetical protein